MISYTGQKLFYGLVFGFMFGYFFLVIYSLYEIFRMEKVINKMAELI